MNMKWIRVGAAVVCAAMLCSCTMPGERNRNDPARIGVILPLTGPYGEYGKKLLSGIRCGRSALLMQPGAQQMPELLIGDSRGLPEDTRKAAQSMIRQGASILLVGHLSSEALAVKSLATENRIPVITPAGSNDRITQDNPFMFRTNFSDRQQAEAIASYIFHTRRIRTMAVMLNLDENAVYSRDLGRQTGQAFSDLGGKITAMVGFRESDKDFSTAINTMLESVPDAIFVPAYAECAARIVAALRQTGFKGLIMGGDSWNGPEFCKKCQDPGDAAFSTCYAPDAPGMHESGFYRLFVEQTKTPPSVHEVLGYDAILLAATAAKNTTTSEEILENFSRIRQFNGATGVVYMVPGGDVSRKVYINRVIHRKDGTNIFRFETVINPKASPVKIEGEKKNGASWTM